MIGENILNKKLRVCSKKPLTGYNRDGYCRYLNNDYGKHLVCAKMNKKFLDYTASKGNNLRRVVKEGDKWCLCEDRYYEAWLNKKAPIVIKKSTNDLMNPQIKNIILRKKNKKDKKDKKDKKYKKYKKSKSKKYKKYNKIQYKTKKKRHNGGKWSKKYKKSIDCNNPKGFSQKQHCKYGRKKMRKTKKIKKTKKMKKTGKKFLYDKKNPKKSMSIFTDENPNDTIPLKYKNMKELKETILKLEKLFKNKKYPHKRILQVAMIMKIRLQIIFEKYKKGDKRYKLAKKYFTFLKKRTKQNTYNKRKNMIFKI